MKNQRNLRYVDSSSEALYTNQVKPYHRAPHLLLGFPTRYPERGWSESMRALPEREHREWRSKASDRYGMVATESYWTGKSSELRRYTLRLFRRCARTHHGVEKRRRCQVARRKAGSAAVHT